MKIQKPHLGFIGWRGMVGSVLFERMTQEGDFSHFNLTFFSSSLAGSPAPTVPHSLHTTIQDAYDTSLLCTLDIIVTTQGGAYSQTILPQLRSLGWNGFWIDAASTFRMEANAKILLDPLNKSALFHAVKTGIKTFAGANCSTATLLMGLAGLFQANLIEWVSFMSYQSISGAGAQAINELIDQNAYLSHQLQQSNHSTAKFSALEKEASLTNILSATNNTHPDFPKTHIGYPLAANILPWIDSDLGEGASREEKKTMAEANKILETHSPIPIDGTCVRVGVLRSHSFGCTIKLKENLPLAEIETLITEAHPWTKLVPNTQTETLKTLTPVTATNNLNVYIGRLRKTQIDPQILNAFIITDQLLWGAAEPLRRMLQILLEIGADAPDLFNQPNNQQNSPSHNPSHSQQQPH